MLAGNPGKRPLNDREPQPQPFDATCPDWLPPYAREEWHRVVPILTACRILTAADTGALLAYCLAMSNLRLSVERKGVADYQALRALRAACAELGMSPSSRSRVVAATFTDEEEKADRYFVA